MPRLARKYISSSYCHIIVQGINKEYIFKDNILKDAYKNLLRKNLSETNISILSYCIMDNHTHLLIYSDEIRETTKLMQRTNTSYAKLYNNLKKRVGYVFRDRYYTQMILTEEQLFNCMVYIHNNPLKANIITQRGDYLYSSYNEYLGKKDLITNQSIKLFFGSDENYNETFDEIHKRNNIEDIIDIKEEIEESNQIIEKYLKSNNKNIEEVINEEESFCELLLQLRHCGGLSLREIGGRMETTGLIIGKFAPLHKGHQYLIGTALKQVDKLIIFIYDWPELTDVPTTVRKGWLEKLYPTAQVVEVYNSPRIFGKTPEIMKLHSDCIVDKLKEIGQYGRITHFFSNEFYGEYMGKVLNAESVQIDINKQHYQISATKIREKPEEYKDFLDKIVYEDLTKFSL